MNTKLTTALLAICLITTQYACRKKDESKDPGNANMSIRLTDAPANYEAVNLDIQKVAITTSTSTNTTETTLTPFRPGIYDILQYKNGLDTLLLRGDIKAGKVQQIRLILGDNSSIKVGGVTYPLNTPSAQESGVKLNIKDSFVVNGAYTLWLDFDAGKSIIQNGNGNFKMKPVIRAYSALTNGKVIGYVFPAQALATVYLINGTDTLSAIPAVNGYVYMNGVPQGNYQVMVVPSVSPYLSYSTNINVVYTSTTNLGSITLL